MTLRVDLDGVGNIYRLCFVRGPWAYFTRIGLDGQWGEGWDKAPYQVHARPPYGDSTDQILKIAFDGPLFPPEAGPNGHALSALELNAGVSPWLHTESYFHGTQIHIMAGVTLLRSTELIELAGGTVFAPIGWGGLPEACAPFSEKAA
ncbi:hypothetical protein J8I87_27785 [Paraburkholderia sp. LEh10]|uniref:hypothetical protein n=1 Tax=Paraburkholderia sp. LEh10 TaxID=2821353 RepID=UPI001AE79A3D|nr:hypothetical protein [Paraburkholderia sp. LEh10]MBP0593430.1 hypothetical protein [Paraburkholderia sp. LEh10]